MQYVNKLKPQVGSLRRAQNNSLPSESSVSPRAANLYKVKKTGPTTVLGEYIPLSRPSISNIVYDCNDKKSFINILNPEFVADHF